MTYAEIICGVIHGTKPGEPIYTAMFAEKIQQLFELDMKKANAAVAVTMKRILDRNQCEGLRFYQKGIYYLTVKTPFGERGINKEALIQHKYLYPDNGYETGYTALHRFGLTTQMPKERVLSTNAAKDCVRADKELGVLVRPPKVKITAENKYYLQMLDVFDLIDKAPIDEAEPYVALAGYIQKQNLQYSKLLAIADRYYGKNTVLQIAHTANMGGKTL